MSKIRWPGAMNVRFTDPHEWRGAKTPTRPRPWPSAVAVASLAIACGYGGAVEAAPELNALYSFKNIRGANPAAQLVADGAGNLYGTTQSGGANGFGVVFEVSPPTDGKKHWTESVLHSFDDADGHQPQGGLIVDGGGNFYGTTYLGGANGDGVVFELSPPKPGKKAWKETVLLSFDGTNGQNPRGNLFADGAGNLFGTTEQGGKSGQGIVFELSPPAQMRVAWKETVLFSFNKNSGSSPNGGLIADGAGNLYGTTQGGGPYANRGLVYEVSPPGVGQAAWTETTLFSFKPATGATPEAGVIADGAGNLYGTTSRGGANDRGDAFELRPPAEGQTTWTQTILVSFSKGNGETPKAGLILDGAGNLFGTTSAGGVLNEGVVFELSPPGKGQTAWSEKVLGSFENVNGNFPSAGLIADSAGDLYGTTYIGGLDNVGVVFKLTP